jgi:hypothetical protein
MNYNREYVNSVNKEVRLKRLKPIVDKPLSTGAKITRWIINLVFEDTV